MSPQFAPGMRVEIRDEEWLIKKIDINTYGKKVLNVMGLSPLVKDREALFLEDLEDIKTILPEETRLIRDESPFFTQSRLYIESQWRQLTPTDEKIHVGHRAAMDLMPYQLEPTLMALNSTRQRILIADAVGLGKTLEAGILISELIARGRGRRILVVTVKSMMLQFQKEFWNRFTIPLERLDSTALRRIRSQIPANHNPFHYYDRSIISIDTLKQDVEYRAYLEDAYWDIIVIDEAHNVAARGKKRAQRSRLAQLLSGRSDTLIMLSATPHDGRAESFASLMNMLDPTAIANPSKYAPEDIEGLCIRRFKKDIQEQAAMAFRERTIAVERCAASPAEEAAYETFVNMELRSSRGLGSGDQLFKTTLEKALFSSPTACMKSIEERVKKLQKGSSDEDDQRDIDQLLALRDDLSKITPENFSRYRGLLRLLRDPNYGWDPKNPNDRVVIFTERIETMRFLTQRLKEDLHLANGVIRQLYGSMSDNDQQKVVEEFGLEESPVRILVATDVASEGINLHYRCHRLIHFDIPWSLMVFQQRNGRIDRYGQNERPDIRYLMTISDNQKIHGDTRILEILVQKEEQAQKNIGDPAALMKVYDIDEEEAKTAEAIETGMSPEAFDEKYSLEEAEFDPLALLLAGAQAPERTNPFEQVSEERTLFSDLDYVRTALWWFTQKERISTRELETVPGLEIELTSDLVRRLAKRIPSEAMPEEGYLRISPDKAYCMREMQRSLQVSSVEKAWPRTQYLWPLHPICEWANDKASLLYGRQQAPVLGIVDGLPRQEVIFILSGIIPNRKANPMVHEWFGLRFRYGEFAGIMSMTDVVALCHLDQMQLPNTNRLTDKDCESLEAMLPKVLMEAEKVMNMRLKDYEDRINPRLDEELDKLQMLHDRHRSEILSLFEAESRRSKEERRVDRIFDDFCAWVSDTLELEKKAHIQVVAVLAGV